LSAAKDLAEDEDGTDFRAAARSFAALKDDGRSKRGLRR
jgi:hypothetical protein